MKLCEYKGKKCKLWEDECLAVFPEQCPYNDKKDIKKIKKWQRRVIKREVKGGEMKKTYEILRELYIDIFTDRLLRRFGDCGFETKWNLFSGSYITTWNKKRKIGKNKEIRIYIEGFSDGYVAAMDKTEV